VGLQNLHFYTSNIPQEELALLSVTGHSVSGNPAHLIQKQIDEMIVSGKKIAIFPEGPYCSPIEK